MAIVQISRITQRKGLATDLPQPLAAAELGWAIDDRKLYIGNGTVAEGAPVIGNTEVLTEFSDILSYATEYTYAGNAAGYAVQTGATTGTPESQSLQSRLDSYAVITDFGATGDGTTDVTADINRAFYQMFCREVNPQIRRSIFFPAGTYIITDTLLIPPFCKLYGEGAESTIINFQVQTWTNTIAYASGVLVYDAGTLAYYRSLAAVPIGTSIGSATYWLAESLPAYMARTTDSLQQTGLNIGSNSALPPGSVEVSGMRFVTNQAAQNGILIEAADNCIFDSVSVAGPGTTTTLQTATSASSCVVWNSTGSYICKHVVWNNCQFSGMVWGTNTDEQIEGCTISNSVFDTLYQGVYLGNTIAPAVGPTGVRIVQNTFDNVYAEGISIVNVGLNATAYNTFYDVGNWFQGTTTPVTPVIDINGNNNVSIGDMFERTTQYADGLHPRIKLNNLNGIALGMNVSNIVFYESNVQDLTAANQIAVGTYQRTAGIQDIIANNSSANLAYISGTYISSFKMDYTITRDVYRRSGTLSAVKGQAALGTGFTYTDSYIENGATGVTLTAAADGANVLVSYSSTNTVSGTINYSITNLG